MAADTGRRERKKAATRAALVRAAQRLFLERGYDGVTVAEIAEEADTAVTTLFKHFPDGKDALIFGDADGDDERSRALVAAVLDRPQGVDPLDALRGFLKGRGPFAPEAPSIARLIAETPALRAYARRQWERAEPALATTLAQTLRPAPSPVACRALARYVLQIPDLASAEADPATALDAIFDHLARGWPSGPVST